MELFFTIEFSPCIFPAPFPPPPPPSPWSSVRYILSQGLPEQCQTAERDGADGRSFLYACTMLLHVSGPGAQYPRPLSRFDGGQQQELTRGAESPVPRRAAGGRRHTRHARDGEEAGTGTGTGRDREIVASFCLFHQGASQSSRGRPPSERVRVRRPLPGMWRAASRQALHGPNP
jgi:hypothetical protein